MKHIRLRIADDHPVFRYGSKALLETKQTLEVVGEASSGQRAASAPIASEDEVRPSSQVSPVSEEARVQDHE